MMPHYKRSICISWFIHCAVSAWRSVLSLLCSYNNVSVVVISSVICFHPLSTISPCKLVRFTVFCKTPPPRTRTQTHSAVNTCIFILCHRYRLALTERGVDLVPSRFFLKLCGLKTNKCCLGGHCYYSSNSDNQCMCPYISCYTASHHSPNCSMIVISRSCSVLWTAVSEQTVVLQVVLPVF